MSIKKLLILSAASLVAVASTAAMAGGPDAMSGPMPAAPAPAVADWTGLYAGANLGGAIGTASTGLNVTTSDGSDTASIGNLNANNFNASSAIMGGQLGYNFEYADFVFGLETNFDYMSQTTSSTGASEIGTTGDDIVVNNEINTNWDYTLRGKLGFSFSDDTMLVYGTGGLALADLSYTSNASETNGAFADPMPTSTQAQARVGWTAGGGLEWKFVPNWSLQGQYLYENLGTMSQSNTVPNFAASGVSATFDQSAKLTENVVTAAINYHF